ncbi:hypothetical protein KFFOFENI_KFFOFENI_02100 [Staphylococcus aureus]|nr:hypothetical protein KFFOFENI_KFFOFENI_02100 [Staphylococcus aureus]
MKKLLLPLIIMLLVLAACGNQGEKITKLKLNLIKWTMAKQ